MALRYSIATFTILALTRRFHLILNRDTVLLSLFTVSSTAFWSYGLELVSSAQSAVLSYTMPLIAIPLSALVLKERANTLGWAGAMVGFSGVFVYGLALGNSLGTLLGAILTIGNAFFWALFTIFYRKVRNQDSVMTVATQFFICALVFWLLTPFGFSLTTTPEFVFDLAYMSLPSGVIAFLLWNALAGMETMARLTTLVFAVPATSIVIQVLVTGVSPGVLSMVGVGLMFLGIYVSRARGMTKEMRVGEPLVEAAQH
jgi:drug/metabolite transporter (DMT)-like permease